MMSIAKHRPRASSVLFPNFKLKRKLVWMNYSAVIVGNGHWSSSSESEIQLSFVSILRTLNIIFILFFLGLKNGNYNNMSFKNILQNITIVDKNILKPFPCLLIFSRWRRATSLWRWTARMSIDSPPRKVSYFRVH